MDSHKKILLLGIILIATLTQITTDMYIPSLSAIAHHFHITMGQSQGTMAAFILGVAITTLIYGPISEVIGRKLTIIVGICIAMVGTLCCIFAINIHWLYIGRLIQGCGLGACSALWRSALRDLFSGTTLTSIGGYLVVAMTSSAILSPFIGGYIQQYFNWQAVFIVLIIWMTIVLMKVMLAFKETSQHHGKHRLNAKFMLTAYGSLLKDRLFMGFSLVALLTYGGLFAWLTAGPAILIHGLHVSPSHFGMLIILTGLSTGASGIAGGKLLKMISQSQMLLLGLLLMLFAGAFLLVATSLAGIHITNVMIAAMIFVFGSTFVFLNCFALGFKQVGEIAGYAGSLYACIQLMGGFIFSGLLGFINSTHTAPMAWMFVLSSILSAMIYCFVIRK